MKYIVFSLVLLSTLAFAGEPVCSDAVTESTSQGFFHINSLAPAFLKGAVIIVRLKDGRESTVPAERFKVVPRSQQFVLNMLKTNKTKSCVTNNPSKNRLSILAGYGSTNRVNAVAGPTSVTVSPQQSGVVGMQYQRMLNDAVSVGVQGQTNATGSLLLGLDF